MCLSRMVQRWCLYLMLILLAVLNKVHSQPGFDSNGFLSIDCGLSESSSYVDSTTNLTYYSDDKFTSTGVNYAISPTYGTDHLKESLTVRSFPDGTRNCYTIRSLTEGSIYLIRATFFYGNYDNLSKPPIFDIFFGFTLWSTVNANSYSFPETIINADAEVLDVCLVNKGQGIPFISSLHLRTLKKGMYSKENPKKSLNLVRRLNMGGSTEFIRYPDDKFDRWWQSYTNSEWKNISYDPNNIGTEPEFQTPPAVMQTAVTSFSLSLFWDSDDSSTKYIFILHFYDEKPTTGRRQFYIFVNGRLSPLEANEFESWGHISYDASGYTKYNVSLFATSSSTLPPLLNAFELFISAPIVQTTYPDDVAAIKSVKQYYKLSIYGWDHDPCLPKGNEWAGIKCSTDSTTKITRITSLDLSSRKLTGSLSDSIGNLTALEYLYLSYNDLSGSIPKSLDNLTSLKVLDIRENPHLDTVLPPGQASRKESKLLEYKYGDGSLGSSLSHLSPSTKKIIALVVPLLIIVIVIVVIVKIAIRRRAGTVAQGPTSGIILISQHRVY